MKPFIIVCDGMDKTIFQELLNQDSFEVFPEPKLSQDKIKELMPKASALVIRSATKVSKELVDMAPNLKYVIRAGEGTDNIDKAYCQEKGVSVSNTPGANANSAAEHAVALMMSLLRKTSFADASMKRGEWNKSAFTGMELADKTVGFVGFGNIGKIVAKRISGFDPKVLFFDPYCEETDIPYAKKVKNLETIFSDSDIITVHTPLVEATKNLINSKLLNLMKPTSILVNAARGGIIDEADLYQHLSDGKIRGAALDVFKEEPLAENDQLKNLRNIILTPHLGASTEEAQVRVGEMAVNQLREFFNNNNLTNEVRV
ncbi:MAG: hydroxyacid dehydrogenase [Bacteriovoracaceae bacterium]|jgi:D-3-phosphoglycerate dehydrogenase|nr:hydroxyacid dehydrogenase [Bacteriovoracaceae bacterium]